MAGLARGRSWRDLLEPLRQELSDHLVTELIVAGSGRASLVRGGRREVIDPPPFTPHEVRSLERRLRDRLGDGASRSGAEVSGTLDDDFSLRIVAAREVVLVF